MTPAALLLAALVAVGPDAPRAAEPSAERKVYEEAKERAGKDPEAHVKLALWCEAHGLDAERTRHLARAVLADPKNATARGLMGLVSHDGRWETPEAVGRRIKEDEALSARLAEYNRRRAEVEARFAPGSRGRRNHRQEAARAHAALGLWCESVGLKAEATAHFTSAVVLDPYHEATWKHLGYVKHDGRWVSHDQLNAERKEADAQRKADRRWEPLLRKWRGWMAVEGRQTEARDHLAGVDDPRAVPSVARVFFGGDAADQQTAVQLLGQIDAPSASRKLAELAVLSNWGRVRATATEVLRRREPRDYAGLLVDMIHTPIRYEVEPVRGPGSPGGLVVDTPRFRMTRTYDAPPAFQLGKSFHGYVGYDANGLPVVASGFQLSRLARDKPAKAERDVEAIEARTAAMIAEANLKAAASQQRLAEDVNAVEAFNAEAAARNQWVIPVLTAALDAPAELKDDEDGWRVWWNDKIGYKYDPPPKVTLAVNASPQYPPPRIMSCFVAGTPVRTPEGHRPIETLAAGDKVLSQDVATGALGFEPVLVVYRNAPGKTIRVELDNGDAVVASVYHRFWRAGKGWAMARELAPGDILRTLGGRATVRAVSPGPVVPVFNLDVAGPRTFFVGDRDALVHDNRLPDPRVRPFDAEPVLSAPSSGRATD